MADLAPMSPPSNLDKTMLYVVRLVPAPGELDETLILAYFLHYMKT